LNKSSQVQPDNKRSAEATDTNRLHPDGVLVQMKQLYRQSLSPFMINLQGELELRDDCSENVRCYLCGGDESTPFLKAAGFRHVLCTQCGLVYVNPRLREDLIEAFYKSDAYNFMFEHMLMKSVDYRLQVVAKKKIEAVKKYAPTGKLKLLDVGCGIGEFAHLAMRENWQVEAIEFNARAAAYARDTLGVSVHEKNLEDCTFAQEQFDIATMWGVLEHLLNPRDLLAQVHEYLKRDGLLVVEVPSYDCLLVEYLKDYPEQADRIVDGWGHIMLFSIPTITSMIEAQGFQIIDTISLGLDIQTILRYVKTADPEIGDHPLVRFLSEHSQPLQEGLEKANNADMIRVFARKR
jgi:cyclopropane fatty-acyl-phospholipid synthase-like methyltransferase